MAATATDQRVIAASATRVPQSGNGTPGFAGSNRGLRHANATTANVNVSPHAAPTSAKPSGTGRSVDPPTPCASTTCSADVTELGWSLPCGPHDAVRPQLGRVGRWSFRIAFPLQAFRFVGGPAISHRDVDHHADDGDRRNERGDGKQQRVMGDYLNVLLAH